MYDKYINYNRVAEEIIRNHKDNEIALQSLKEQLEALKADDGVGAIQYDSEPVQTSPTADEMVNRAIQKEVTEKRIRELEFESRQYERAWERLNKEEQQILEIFFKLGMYRQDAIDIICEQFYCEKTKAYSLKTNAVNHFRRLLFG